MSSTIYSTVQAYMTTQFNNGLQPKMADIHQHVYGSQSVMDSRVQRGNIYSAIRAGRDAALAKWDEYIKSQQFSLDLEQIEFYEADKVEAQFRHRDYGRFFSELYRGTFGAQTSDLKKYRDEYAHIACCWDKKLTEFSKNGQNLVVATYGRESSWELPTYWRWAMRENALWVRSTMIIIGQLKRGVKAGLPVLPSGKLIEKAIGYAESTRALLTDGSSWTCLKCGMINASNFCSNCGAPKPT